MRANRLRTALTVLVIALPVLVVSAGMTLIATYSVSNAEAIPRQLGMAQALLTPSMTDGSNLTAIRQSPDGTGTENLDAAAKPLPGWTPGGRPPPASSVQQVTGGTILAHSTQNVRVVLGDRRVRGSITGLDGKNPTATGIAILDSGRWPATAGEVLVSKVGVATGIPTSGSLRLDSGEGPQRSVRIVGTVTTHDGSALLTLPNPAFVDSYLLGGASAILLPQIQRLNTYGLSVDSRYDREHPSTQNSSGGLPMVVGVLIVTGVVIMTVLLAGPALTVSGARHRRALAQLASNGATAAMLRRYVFGQALLFGAISSVVGVGAGCLFGLLGARVILWFRPTTEMGPTDIPVLYALGLAAVAAASCLGAALVPAMQAARTNVVAALRGQVSPRRVRRGLPVVGLVVAVVGGILLFTSAMRSAGGEIGVAGGAVLLFLGATMCLPAMLAAIGRLAGRLPLAGRVGVRDVARQRSRSASAVGARMAVVALTTALAVGGTSDLTQSRRDYKPSGIAGVGQVVGTPSAMGSTMKNLPAQLPGVLFSPISVPADGPMNNGESNGQSQGSKPTTLVATLAPGCTIEGASRKVPEGVLDGACGSPSNLNGDQVVVADSTPLSRVLLLSAANRTLLDRGGVIVARAPDPRVPADQVVNPVRDGVVRLGVASGSVVGNSFQPSSSRTTTLPAASVKVDVGRASSLGTSETGQYAALMTPATAKTLGIRQIVNRVLVSQRGGVTADTERNISDLLPNEANVSVERGFDSSSVKIIWIMMAVMAALLLIVTVIGTALVQGESAPDQATLGALGAPAGLRRRIAASQALALGLTGSVVGLVIGLVPGIAITWPLTNVVDYQNPTAALPGPTIDIPWLALLAVVIGVPLLAALAAVAFQRRTPSLTARIT